MFVDWQDRHTRLRAEIRSYFDQLVTPELEARLTGDWSGPAYREIVGRMGRDGWLGIGWPTEYGGQGRGALEQLIFLEEAHRAGAPIPLMSLGMVGPTLMAYGTEEQKRTFLPGIVAGEIHFAIGYSEPQGGTDLASLRTRAVRDGDTYVVNGQKTFTTGGDEAEFIWLACRTGTVEARHKGISILIVDGDSPGLTATPIDTVGGYQTTATYYDNVEVPASRLVGDENDGWRLITNALNLERASLVPAGTIIRNCDDVASWARRTIGSDGQRIIDHGWVQGQLGRVRARAAALELLNWKIASTVDREVPNPADASAMKVFGSELWIESLRLLMEVVGTASLTTSGSADAAIHGRLEREYRQAIVTTFGGGANELQREIVASAGLHLPRVRR